MKRRRQSRLIGPLAAVLLVAAGTAIVPASADAAEDVRGEQWYLDALHIAEAQQLTKGEGVTIGIIDSGVDATHPDLDGAVVAGPDFTDPTRNGAAASGNHGTSVASLLVGRGDAGGVLGIAPAAKVLSVRNVGSDGKPVHGYTQTGIRWLVDNGADVISISQGDPADEPDGQAAVDYAISKNVVVVAAAGNVRGDEPGEVWGETLYPAAYKGVVAVTGTTRDGTFWDGSVKHTYQSSQTGIAAPAKGIPVAVPGGGYETADGTSLAAPIVAGTMALIKAKYPDLNQRQLLERLLLTADDKGDKGADLEYGWGLVNPLRALTENVDYAEPPVPATGSASDGPTQLADSGTSGLGDFVPVLVTSSGLVVVVGAVVALLVVGARRRARRRAAGSGGGNPYGPVGG